MFRSNIDVGDGLVNGATGWLEDVSLARSGDEGSECVVGVWVKFDQGGERWQQVNGTNTVLVNPTPGQFNGLRDNERVRRVQFPLVLAWGKTIHKSQGAPAIHGAAIYLTKRDPCFAYVALSRCKRLKDVHWLGRLSADVIVSPDEGCYADSVDILWPKIVLKVLRAQQRERAGKMDALWCELFHVADPPEPQLFGRPVNTKMQLLMQANEDEAMGRPPKHVCEFCQEGFYLEEALERRQKNEHKDVRISAVLKTSKSAKWLRKRPASWEANDGAKVAARPNIRLTVKTSPQQLIHTSSRSHDARMQAADQPRARRSKTFVAGGSDRPIDQAMSCQQSRQTDEVSRPTKKRRLKHVFVPDIKPAH